MHVSPTFIHSDASEEGGLGVKDADLGSIDCEGDTIGRNVGVDGDQGVGARRNGEAPVAGEIAYGEAGVLDAKIGIREGKSGAGCERIVLCTRCNTEGFVSKYSHTRFSPRS